jgi:hypothetical protein
MTKTPSGFGEPSAAVCGLKKPWASHQSYQAASTACGLYPAAIGWDKSMHTSASEQAGTMLSGPPFLSPLGVVLTNAGSSAFFSFSALAFFSPAGVAAGCLSCFAASFASFSRRFASFLAVIAPATDGARRDGLA